VVRLVLNYSAVDSRRLEYIIITEFTIYGKTARLIIEDEQGEFEVAAPFMHSDGIIKINLERVTNALDSRANGKKMRPVH
jgi:hypothetical protein